MNHYAARERKDGSGWHFTVQNDGHIWPVGYCDCHAPHQTKEEAETCYKKFLLDTRLILQEAHALRAGDTVLGCRVCGELTVGGAVIDTTFLPLCPEHRTREHVEQVWKPSAERWGSW
jgi:hypothetical protein